MNILEELREANARTPRSGQRSWYARTLRQFRLFRFDGDASRLLGRVAGSMSDMLVEHEQFAAAPYRSTILQVDYRAYMDGAGKNCDGRSGDDHHLGFLVFDDGDGGRQIATVAASEKSDRLVPCVWEYFRGQPDTEPALRAVELLRTKLYRGGVDSPTIELPPNAVRAVVHHGSGTWVVLGPPGPETAHPPLPWGLGVWAGMRDLLRSDLDGARLMLSQRGDLRLCLSALLMLNRPSRAVFRVSEEPAGWGVSAGRVREYQAHHVVTLALSPRAAVRRVRRAARAAARRHEVRGHYCHSRRTGSELCDHDWETVSEARRWRCRRCRRERWWRDAHLRGDAGRGWVRKEYEVTP